MRFSANSTKLADEIGVVLGVVERKNTIQILSNLLIEAHADDRITIQGTDLDSTLTTDCAATVGAQGAIVVPARKLFDIIRNFPSGSEVHFERVDKQWVRIISGACEFKVMIQDKAAFPDAPGPVGPSYRFPASLLSGFISKTVYAITQEDSRYALNGSLFQIADGTLRMVSTDGHRLAMASKATDEKLDDLKVIIPKKALSELLKLTSAGGDEQVEFFNGPNHLYFKIGRRSLASRMLAGQFPNYELVMPKDNDKTVTLGKDILIQSIRRAVLMADERSQGIKLDLEAGKLTITSQSADVGEAKEVLPIDYSGSVLTIGFNGSYLLDFLNTVSSEQVVFEVKDHMSPAHLRPAAVNGLAQDGIVMPMRLL